MREIGQLLFYLAGIAGAIALLVVATSYALDDHRQRSDEAKMQASAQKKESKNAPQSEPKFKKNEASSSAARRRNSWN